MSRCAECPEPALLPENRLAALAYCACDTQWRVGFVGATGLDGAACALLVERMLPKWRRELAIEDETDVADVLTDLHVIEHATLAVWAEQRAAEKDKTP